MWQIILFVCVRALSLTIARLRKEAGLPEGSRHFLSRPTCNMCTICNFSESNRVESSWAGSN
jgi:hypothetical protein